MVTSGAFTAMSRVASGGPDQFLAEVGPVDLEEELQDVPVGGPLGIEGDLDRLGVTRMVVGGRVVVLAAGIADAGGDDPRRGGAAFPSPAG